MNCGCGCGCYGGWNSLAALINLISSIDLIWFIYGNESNFSQWIRNQDWINLQPWIQPSARATFEFHSQFSFSSVLEFKQSIHCAKTFCFVEFRNWIENGMESNLFTSVSGCITFIFNIIHKSKLLFKSFYFWTYWPWM